MFIDISDRNNIASRNIDKQQLNHAAPRKAETRRLKFFWNINPCHKFVFSDHLDVGFITCRNVGNYTLNVTACLLQKTSNCRNASLTNWILVNHLFLGCSQCHFVHSVIKHIPAVSYVQANDPVRTTSWVQPFTDWRLDHPQAGLRDKES